MEGINMHFDEKTTTQLAAYFLMKNGGKMSYLKLIKLLYFTDREYIKQTGSSITKDTYFSMKNGPVLSNVLDLIHTEPEPNHLSYWNSIISDSNSAYELKIVNEPDFEALSPAAMEIADKIYEDFGKLTRWKVRDISHELPEYSKLDEGRESIEYRDIAKALLIPDDLIEDYLEEEKTHSFVCKALKVQG